MGGSYQNPEGIKFRNGDLFVVDMYYNNLQEWTTLGVQAASPLSIYGSGPTTFSRPYGVSIDPVTGNIYVADYFNHQVAVFDPNENYLTVFGAAQMGTGFVQDAEVNSTGTTVYLMDETNSQVIQYTIGGTPSSPTFSYPSTIITGLHNLSGMALDGSNNIYEMDYSGHYVKKFPPTGGSSILTFDCSSVVGFSPVDATIDPSGYLYVVGMSSVVLVFNPSGALVGQFGAGILTTCEGITTDGAGNFYATQANGREIIGFH